MAAAMPLTDSLIDSLVDVIEAIPMLEQYGVSVKGLKGVEEAKIRLRRKMLEDSGRRLRKPGDAAKMMKDVLQSDKENRQELLHLCDSATHLLMTTLEPDVRIYVDKVFGDVKDILTRCRNQLVKDDCPILVAGETSSGKSTLLNVLLGENILPSSVLSTTSVICEIKYGTRKKAVIHLNEPDPITGEKVLNLPLNGPAEADLERISQYIHVKGEAREGPSNCYKVEIFWPLPLLEGGIFIVDSPGVGESAEMDEHVSKYISDAYAFMYVINSANAGGVQPGRLPQLLELSRRAGPQDLQLFDPKAAIFVCNKWDQIRSIHEKEKVKQDTLRKLKKHWPLLDDSQLFCLSALQAQEAGYVTDDLDKLLDGIDSLLPRSLRHKLTIQYSWIWILIKECTKIVRAKLNNAKRSHKERTDKCIEVEERLIKFKLFTDNVIKQLADRLQKAENSAMQNLRRYLGRDETKALIVRQTLREAPSLNSIAECDTVQEQIINSVLSHIKDDVERWISSQSYFKGIEESLIEEFKDSFNLIEEEHHYEIDQALGADLQLPLTASPQDTEDDIRDNKFGVLGMVTAPLWIPIAIVAGVLTIVICLPIAGVLALKKKIEKRLTDKKFMAAYNRDKEGYIREITKKTTQYITETNVLEGFVTNHLQRPKECLIKLSSAIPNMIEADKRLIKNLEEETRSQEVLLKLYDPQLQKCNALQGKLALFQLRHLRQKEYNLDKLLTEDTVQKIGSGGFGEVYKVKVMRKGCMMDAALKTAKEVITEENVMEFHTEDKSLRHLKDAHIVDYYGLATTPQLKSGGLRLGIVMEYCPYTLHSWLNGHKERTPAWWPGDEAKMTAGFSTVKDLALQLCLGLKAMHEKRYMHRDLKLENVLVTEGGVVKIADMGLAKNLEEVTGTQAGTVLYAAPEVFHGREHYDISADIYSLGFCLLEMWYGLSVTEDKDYLQKVLSSTQKSVSPPTKLPIQNTLPPCSGWVDLMKVCWKDPKSRPSADLCVQLISKMKL